MNVRETTAIRELSADDLDQVSGGFGPWLALTFAGGFYEVAKHAVISAVSVMDWE